MTMLFERFNEKALRSVLWAQEQSRRMGQPQVNVDTLLLGVLKQGGGVTEKVVKRLNLDLAAITKTLQDSALTAPCAEWITFFPNLGRRQEIKAEIQRMEEEAEKTGDTTGLVQKKATKALDEFGKNLTEAAANGLMDPLVGQDVPEMLTDKIIIELDMGSLLSGAKYRGEIDEIHTLVGAGGGGDGGAMDAANILKPALARGDMQIIGATTVEEYRKYVEKDKALERRFQPVSVPEPTVDEAVQILRGIARKYEAHHRIRYSEEALQSCAIDLLDETGARVQLRQLATVPEDAWELRQELRDVEAQKESAVRVQDAPTGSLGLVCGPLMTTPGHQDFKKAGELKKKEDDLQCQLYQFMKKSKDEPPAEPVEEQRWPGRGWDVMGGPPGFGGGKPQREARGACRFEPS
eukprot:g20610.t1